MKWGLVAPWTAQPTLIILAKSQRRGHRGGVLEGVAASSLDRAGQRKCTIIARLAVNATLAAVIWLACACTQKAPAPTTAEDDSAVVASAELPVQRLVWVDAGANTSLPAQVQQVNQQAKARGQQLLVYVGAAWCEPCRYFHDAAMRGQLDGDLALVTVLAFDADRDREQLDRAGYQSKMIPLLAIPRQDGHSSGQMLQGSVKGPGAVANLVPRVQQLLRSAPPAAP